MRRNFNLQISAGPSLVTAPLFCAIAIFCFTYLGTAQDASAQINAGGGGGIPVDGGNVGGGFPTDGGNGDFDNGGGLGTGGDNSSNDSGAFGDDAEFGQVLGGEDTVDERNQGFVGSTGTRIQENGFIGPPGESTGPPLADGATFGGGTNDVGTAGGGGGGGNQNRNTGFGGVTGQVKGFEVFRSNVRANLRPKFSSPQVSNYQIVDRFQSRIRRLPDMNTDGSGVQISISNRTATIAGYVRSAEESNRIERQLRLEPGVYKIDNQTRIAGQ